MDKPVDNLVIPRLRGARRVEDVPLHYHERLRAVEDGEYHEKLIGNKSLFEDNVNRTLEEINPDMSMDQGAKDLLQKAGEAFLLDFFDDTLFVALGRKRVTILSKDMQRVIELRREAAVVDVDHVQTESPLEKHVVRRYAMDHDELTNVTIDE